MVFVAESMRRQATNSCWDWGSNISDKCLIRRMSWESLINAILRCFDIWICVASPDTINQILPLFWFLLIRRKCGLRGDYATDDFIFVFCWSRTRWLAWHVVLRCKSVLPSGDKAKHSTPSFTSKRPRTMYRLHSLDIARHIDIVNVLIVSPQA